MEARERELLTERAEEFFRDYLAVRADGVAEIDYCVELGKVVDFVAREVGRLEEEAARGADPAYQASLAEMRSGGEGTLANVVWLMTESLRAELRRRALVASSLRKLVGEGAAHLKTARNIIVGENICDVEDVEDEDDFIKKLEAASLALDEDVKEGA